jgi:hypothetical protein
MLSRGIRRALQEKMPVKNAHVGLDIPRGTVGLARLDGLAGLLDLLEDRLVVERLFCDDFGSLCFERDVVRLDTWESQRCEARGSEGQRGAARGSGDLPSSFLRTRSTAPEQPPQLMAMLNL